MKRDLEIERLVKYAQALGVKVLLSKAKNDEDSAEWALDGKQITIYTKNQDSKTETILTLVHEIAHSLDNIHRHNRELDVEFDKALEPNEDGEIGKRKRKVILNSEIAATEYWHTIYKETNLQIPLWKLYAQMEMDIWQYEVYYETGSYPNRSQRKKKHKEIFAKHKGMKYD